MSLNRFTSTDIKPYLKIGCADMNCENMVCGSMSVNDVTEMLIGNDIDFTNQTDTPSNPSPGETKIYTKLNSKLYSLDSDGNEFLVGDDSGDVTQLESKTQNISLANTVPGLTEHTGTFETDKTKINETVDYVEQLATPALPPVGENKVYFKNDSQMYCLNSSGVEKQYASYDQSLNTTDNVQFNELDLTDRLNMGSNLITNVDEIDANKVICDSLRSESDLAGVEFGTNDIDLQGGTVQVSSGAFQHNGTDCQLQGSGAVQIQNTGSCQIQPTGPLSLKSFSTTGDIVMGGTAKVRNLATPTDPTDSANKDYVDTQVSGVDLTDLETKTQNILLGDTGPTRTVFDQDLFCQGTFVCNSIDNFAGTIIDVSDPINPQDAATKNYVDTEIGNIDLSTKLNIDGSLPMTGDLNMSTNNIIGIQDSITMGGFAAPYKNQILTGSGANANISWGASNHSLLTSGIGNVSIGYLCGSLINTGSRNTLVGYEAGSAITTGQNNVCLGRGSGLGLSTGIGNLCIGTGSTSSGDTNVSIGLNATCSGFDALALGSNSVAGSKECVFGSAAVDNLTVVRPGGDNQTDLGTPAIKFKDGYFTTLTATNMTCNTDPTAAQEVATKNYVDTTSSNNNYLLKTGGTMSGNITNLRTNDATILLGSGASSSSTGVVVGQNAGSSGTSDSTCIGNTAGGNSQGGSGCVAIGSACASNGGQGDNSVAIGYLAGTFGGGLGERAVCIGYSSQNAFDDSIAIISSDFPLSVSASNEILLQAGTSSLKYNTNGLYIADNVIPTNGNAKIFGGLYVGMGNRPVCSGGYTATGTTTIGNTGVETNMIPSGIGSLTTGANVIKVGSTSEVIISGDISSIANNEIIRFRLKINGVEVSTFDAEIDTTTSEAFQFHTTMVCKTPGAAGSMYSNTIFTYVKANLDSKGSGNHINFPINTTIANTFSMTAQWIDVNAGNIIVVELFNTKNVYQPI